MQQRTLWQLVLADEALAPVVKVAAQAEPRARLALLREAMDALSHLAEPPDLPNDQILRWAKNLRWLALVLSEMGADELRSDIEVLFDDVTGAVEERSRGRLSHWLRTRGATHASPRAPHDGPPEDDFDRAVNGVPDDWTDPAVDGLDGLGNLDWST